MRAGVRVEVQVTGVLTPPAQHGAGFVVRYNVVVVNETLKQVDVLARDQETLISLPQEMVDDMTGLMHEVAVHMMGIVGLATTEVSPLAAASEDGTPTQNVDDDTEL